MKKSVLFRVALVMLVLTMVTSCFVGGTFAKYVTSGEGTDSARVAKFGVAITANGETFATSYAAADTTATSIATTVQASEKVVAPGTQGNMASMVLSGVPEVAVKVSYEGAFDISSNWTVDGRFYCPLVITVGETEIDGATYTEEVAFENAVNDAFKNYWEEYAPGTDLSVDSVKADSLGVSWEWPFYVDEANDAKDTWLGNQAAAGNAATVTLTVKTTVEQID